MCVLVCVCVAVEMRCAIRHQPSACVVFRGCGGPHLSSHVHVTVEFDQKFLVGAFIWSLPTTKPAYVGHMVSLRDSQPAILPKKIL